MSKSVADKNLVVKYKKALLFASLIHWDFAPSLSYTGPWWILLFEGRTWTSHSPEAASKAAGHEANQQWNQELGPHGNDQALWWRGRCFCCSGSFWNIQQLNGNSAEAEGSGAAAPQPRLWTTSQGATSRRWPGVLGGNLHEVLQSYNNDV